MGRTGPLIALVLVAAPAVAGSVEIRVREDGTRVMMNEPGEARARRLADRKRVDRADISGVAALEMALRHAWDEGQKTGDAAAVVA